MIVGEHDMSEDNGFIFKNTVWFKHELYLGYLFSQEGNILSLHGSAPIVKKKTLRSDGYHCVTLYYYKDGKSCRTTPLVHRLIGHVFLEKKYNKIEINHKDGNKTNNDITNLEWVTTKENSFHCHNVLKRKMPYVKGSGHINSKLTEKNVIEIKKMLLNKEMKQYQIGDIFGVSFQNISCIKRGKTWNHVR